MRGQLVERTEKDYRAFVRRWTADGEPEPAEWVKTMSSPATRRNARAALIWYHRVELGKTLDIPWVSDPIKVPTAYAEQELASLRESAEGVHPRCRPTIELLYTTGARLGEMAGVLLEDVSETHIQLRETKRRPGGLRVERAVPLNPTSRAACEELRGMPGSRSHNLIGASKHYVQDWMVGLQRRTGIRCHAHKFRSTFCTHLLQRGVPIHEVQRLMGHTSVQTTMRYAAVTDDRLRAAVALLG